MTILGTIPPMNHYGWYGWVYNNDGPLGEPRQKLVLGFTGIRLFKNRRLLSSSQGPTPLPGLPSPL